MEYSGSEWSTSRCESGWTSYFDESTLSSDQCRRGKSNKNGNENYISGRNSIHEHKRGDDDEEEEEEDLSMVSDASSGPPPHSQDSYHYHHHHDDCYDPIPSGNHFPPFDILPKESDDKKKKKKKKKKNGSDQKKGKQQKNSFVEDTATSLALNPSNGNSANNNQFGFWKWSRAKNSDTAEPSHMRGKRWK